MYAKGIKTPVNINVVHTSPGREICYEENPMWKDFPGQRKTGSEKHSCQQGHFSNAGRETPNKCLAAEESREPGFASHS